MQYSINAWGSHPDSDNDDCWYGEDVNSIEDAIRVLGEYIQRQDKDTQFIEVVAVCSGNHTCIDPDEFRYLCKNPYYRPRQCDNEWRNEIANQAGMMGGIEAYNEVMGY